MNVRIVRLKSGEELIGLIAYQDHDVIKIDKPCIILPSGDAGQIGLYKFMPYATVDTDGLQLLNTDTYFVATPQKDLEDYYKQLIGDTIHTDDKIVV